MSDFYFNPYGSDELYHYGIPGMRWGHRKSPNSYDGSITKSGKYKASNGVVIAKSKNPAVAAMRRFSTSVPGRALSAVGRGQMSKATGRSKESLKNQEKREREALKEYYKVGGDKMLKKSVNNRNSNNSGNQKQPMSTKKKAAIAATAVVGTALAAYGAYKVSKFIKMKNVQIATEKGKEIAKEYMDSNKMNLKVIQKFKDGTYRVAAKTKYSSSHLSPMNKEELRSTVRDIGEYNAKIMNTANGLKNQTINKAANDNLLSATKNVARYYKKISRY